MDGIGDGLALLDRALEPAAVALGALLALRVAVPLLLDLAGGLPGAAGRVAARIGRALRPALARRLLALGVGLAAGLPAVITPGARAATAGTAPSSAGFEAAAERVELAPPVVVHPRAETVVVRRGDTLWDIARRHLHPGAGAAEIARAWPRWYAANRRVIGPDPNLIVPGMRLRAPVPRLGTEASSRPAGTPAQHHRPALHVDASSLDPDRR